MAHRIACGRRFFSSRLGANFASLLALLGIALCAQAGNGHAEASRQAPNSRVALEVPESFVASDRFSGFVDEKSGASFLIVEMPAIAWDEVKTIGDKTEALGQKGITDVKKSELAGRSGDYVFVTGKQKTATGDYGKYIMVARESDVTMMITANIPEKAVETNLITRQQVERAFVSATVKAEALKGAELFTLAYLGPFKETLSIMGNSKVYSLTGKIPEPGTVKTTQEPIFVISPSVDKGPVGDVKVSAHNSFKVIGNLSGHEVKSENDVTVGGLKGYEIVGEGDDPKTGTRSGLYVVLLSGGDGYYVMAGLAPAAGMPTYLPEFQKIATSFAPKAGQ
jgi:hypothetical protein